MECFENFAKHKKWQMCPKCKFYVEKSFGCMKVKCSEMKTNEQIGETKITREISAQMKKVIEDNYLLTEILVHIHPAIVISFKSVSKRWLNLISSHPFRLYHSSLSPAYFPSTSLIMQASSPPPPSPNPSRSRKPNCLKSFAYHTSSRSQQANDLMGSSVPRGDTFLRSLESRNRKLLYLLKNDELVYQRLDLSISFIFDDRPNPSSVSFEILHASNGLLLLSVKASCGTRDYVCNPLTRDYIQLPPIPYQGQSRLPIAFSYDGRRPELRFVQKSMRLVFDPLKTAHYKVVCISYKTLPDGSYICVQVYSSTNRSWGIPKEISSSAELHGIFDSVVFKDVLCWTTSTSGKRLHIFDVSSLSIRSLPLPECHLGSLFHLFESRSILYLAETLNTDIKVHILDENDLNSLFSRLRGQHTSNFSYRIWEMKDIENSSWETKFEFQLEDRMETVHIRCSHKQQGLQIFLLAHDSFMFCLNSENYAVDKELEHVGVLFSEQTQRGIYSIGSRMSRPWDIITYTNTLFPLV